MARSPGPGSRRAGLTAPAWHSSRRSRSPRCRSLDGSSRSPPSPARGAVTTEGDVMHPPARRTRPRARRLPRADGRARRHLADQADRDDHAARMGLRDVPQHRVPCSVSGYQTFTVATKVEQSPTVATPLWAYLHGGGVGYFSPDGTPQPSAGQKVEENPATQVANLTKGLNGQIRSHTVGCRMLAVSMCTTTSTAARHRRPGQPRHHARRRAPHGQRPVRHQGGGPVRARPLPHRRPLPLRHQRRRVRVVQRRLGARAPGHPGHRHRRRLGHPGTSPGSTR